MCDNKIMMMKTVNEVVMSVKLTPRKKLFVETATEMFGNGSTISRAMTKHAASKAGVPFPTWFKKCKVGYNMFQLPEIDVPSFAVAPPAPVAEDAVVNLIANMEKQNLVPAPFVGFVPWGNYSNLKKIVKSGLFYPVFITGLSGNGKTLMVEQLHAELNKELIRVNGQVTQSIMLITTIVLDFILFLMQLTQLKFHI